MKKEERLHRLFGDIDDDLVADAANRPIPLRVWLPRVTAAVAAVALVVGAVLTQPWAGEKPPVSHTSNDGAGGDSSTTATTVQQNAPETDVPDAMATCPPDHVAPPRPTAGTSTTTATMIKPPEIWYEPKWDEKPIWMKFPDFERFEIGTYTIRDSCIDKAMVKEYLEDVNLHGYDIYTETAYDIAGKIYRIKGINPDCAVAIQYPDRTDFFPAVCSKYTPETLGQFITDVNLKETLRVGTVYGSYLDEQGLPRSVEYEGLTAEKVWELLMQVTDATNEYNYEKVIELDGSMDISVSVPLLGIHNVGLRATVDGYLFTNLMDTGKIFYIGEAATAEFMDYVRNHCRAVYDQGPQPGDTTTHSPNTTMTSAAQPPLVTGTTVQKPR